MSWVVYHDPAPAWPQLPLVLCAAAEDRLKAAKLGDLQLEETRVYASYDTEDRGR